LRLCQKNTMNGIIGLRMTSNARTATLSFLKIMSIMMTMRLILNAQDAITYSLLQPIIVLHLQQKEKIKPQLTESVIRVRK